MVRIFPSLISADLLNLASVIEKLESYCDGFHLDIMDNNFVPNLTLGPSFANAIGKLCTKQLWVHLMVQDPPSIIQMLDVPTKSIITFHVENNIDHIQTIKMIREKGWYASMAINPNTTVEKLFPYLELINHALIMSVEPGFSGQQFIGKVIEKIPLLIEKQRAVNTNITIGIDGGINNENIEPLKELGITDFAVASYIFSDSNSISRIQNLKKVT